MNVISLIVVPLDGSPLAEQALEPAHYLAQRLHADIEVVQVFEPSADPPHYPLGASTLDTRLDIELRAQAKAYIESVAEREQAAGGVRVTGKLLDGPVVETLAKHVAALDRPLVVMTTHGRSGLGRALLGSVTVELVRTASVPVLTIRARKGSEVPTSVGFGRVLVPIAGPDFGADMGERTADIFGTDAVEYVLLHAILPVPLVAPMDPSIPPVLPDLSTEEEAANKLLDSLAARLRARGAHVRTHVVFDADATHAILQAVNEAGADTVSMATHGHRGIKRLVLGSVADKVLRHSPVPVLVLHPPEPIESKDHEEAERVAAR
jgi:nucleotide-binding universal stress UspA family protein